MSSSQGAAAVLGYPFAPTTMIRDASDWTRYIKESDVYNDYNSGNVYSRPPYLVRSNEFRLTYANGRFKCATCNGNAFANIVVPGVLLN